jgi:glycine cleavage system H protein
LNILSAIKILRNKAVKIALNFKEGKAILICEGKLFENTLFRSTNYISADKIILRRKRVKKIQELNIPDDRKYSRDHGWAKLEDGIIKVGISDFAQSELGDIVYVEMPETGRKIQKDSVYGTIESVKSVSELRAPVGGQVTATNKILVDSPQQVNQSPYDNGWIIELKPENQDEINSLMPSNTYLDMLQGKK